MAGAFFFLGHAGQARADDRATAQQLFGEGKALMEAGKLGLACPKFDAAAQLSPTPGVRLNLAECWARLGRVASAWAKYKEALALAELAGDVAAADAAKRARAELEPKLSYLTVTSTDPFVSGLSVLLDGLKIPLGALGTPQPIDPGEHVVTASAPGRRGWSQPIVVGMVADRPNVAIPALAPEVPPAPAPPEAAAAPAPAARADVLSARERQASEPSPFGTQRILAVAAAGLGLAGLGVGAGFGFDAIGKKNGYLPLLSPAGDCTTGPCREANRQAVTASAVSTVGFAAGAALVGVGAVLWLTAPSGASSSGATARLSCFGTTRAPGLSLEGTWR